MNALPHLTHLAVVPEPDSYVVTIVRTTDGIVDWLFGLNYRWQVTTARGKWVRMDYARTERAAERKARRAAERHHSRPAPKHAKPPRSYFINL